MKTTTNTAATVPAPFAYDKDQEANTTEKQAPCACCGKPVKTATERYFAHVVDGGSAWGGEGDTGDGGDMGWYPIGPSCAKRLRACGVYVQDTKAK